MRTIIADDHALVREGLVSFFRSSQPDWDVREAASMDELAAMARTGADFVLADLDMPGMKGAETLLAFRASNPNVKLAVLTGTDRRETILACLSAGVHGYILKAETTSELLSAVRLIISGGIYVPSRLSSLNTAAPAGTPERPIAPDLTARQSEVLQLLAKGMSTKSIARQLSLGVGTVKAHLASLYRVLDVHTRMEAVVKARALNGF